MKASIYIWQTLTKFTITISPLTKAFQDGWHKKFLQVFLHATNLASAQFVSWLSIQSYQFCILRCSVVFKYLQYVDTKINELSQTRWPLSCAFLKVCVLGSWSIGLFIYSYETNELSQNRSPLLFILPIWIVTLEIFVYVSYIHYVTFKSEWYL